MDDATEGEEEGIWRKAPSVERNGLLLPLDIPTFMTYAGCNLLPHRRWHLHLVDIGGRDPAELLIPPHTPTGYVVVTRHTSLCSISIAQIADGWLGGSDRAERDRGIFDTIAEQHDRVGRSALSDASLRLLGALRCALLQLEDHASTASRTYSPGRTGVSLTRLAEPSLDKLLVRAWPSHWVIAEASALNTEVRGLDRRTVSFAYVAGSIRCHSA